MAGDLDLGTMRIMNRFVNENYGEKSVDLNNVYYLELKKYLNLPSEYDSYVYACSSEYWRYDVKRELRDWILFLANKFTPDEVAYIIKDFFEKGISLREVKREKEIIEVEDASELGKLVADYVNANYNIYCRVGKSYAKCDIEYDYEDKEVFVLRVFLSGAEIFSEGYVAEGNYYLPSEISYYAKEFLNDLKFTYNKIIIKRV